MFEDINFGGVSASSLDIIKEFLTTEDAKGRTRLSDKQISLILNLLRDIWVLKRYYGDDFKPLNDLEKLIVELTEFSISRDGASRKEAKESLMGIMNSEGMQTNLQRLTEDKKEK